MSLVNPAVLDELGQRHLRDDDVMVFPRANAVSVFQAHGAHHCQAHPTAKH